MIKHILLLLLLPIVIFASTQKVSVQLDWKHQFEFAGFYAAKSQGYYRDIDLEVELKEFELNMNITDEVIQSRADFGVSSSSLILDKLQNKPVVLIGSYFKQNALALVTTKNIKSIQDLKNRKIMATKNEVEQTSLSVMLKENKLNRDNFTLVEQEFNVDKFISGEIDAMSVFITNQLFYLDKHNIEYNIFIPSDYGIYSYDSELFTSLKYMQTHPSLVKEFTEATRKGWEYAFGHKEEIIKLIHDEYSSKKSIEALRYEATQIEKLFKIETFQIGSIVPELVELNAVIYEKLGLVDKNINLKKLLTNYIFDDKYQRVNKNQKIHLTKEENRFLKNHPLIKVHMEDNYSLFSYVKNDKFIGYSIDYADMIAKRLGITFSYNRDENWKQAIDNLKSFKTDIVAQMINTKERGEFALFSDNYMRYDQAIVVQKKDKHLSSLAKLHGKKVGVIDGYYNGDVIAKHYPEIILVKYSDNKELVKGVHLGEVDAGVSTHQDLQYKINTLLLNNLISIPILNNPYMPEILEAFGIRKDWPLMHSALQKAFKSISAEEIAHLQLKWFGKVDKEKLQAEKDILNTKEREYLNKNSITMCTDPDWMPFEKLENETHIGMSADYFKIINQNLRTNIKIVPTSSWSESIKKAKNRECDLLSLAMQTSQREEYMNFTSSYLSVPLVLATKMDVPFIADIQSVKGKEIGIPKGYAFAEILKDKYPDLKIVQVKNIQDGLKRVNRGELFGYIGTLASVGYMFQQEYVGELKIAGKFDESWKLGIGVRNDDTTLLSIMQKAVNSINKEQKREILNRWIVIKYEKGVDYSIVWKLLLVFSLIIIAALFWFAKLSLLNKKLEIAKQKAEEAAQTKATFLANMSHEIRTPMNSIIGMSYLIKETKLNKTQLDYIEKIENSSHNLLTLINNILDFSKMEIKKLELKNDNFNLLQVLNDIENILKIKTFEKELSLQILYNKSDNFHLYGDSLRLSQVLINLVSNAIKFTQKGEVKVIVEKQEGNLFRFIITDTGIGLTQEQAKSVFSSFTQADSSITRKYGGTGLGLSISKELVELMGGKIWVESIYGEGSRFIFEIPIQNSSSTFLDAKIKNKLKSEDLQEKKPLIEKVKLQELLEELKEATKRRRPQLCEPILKKINIYTLEKEDQKLFDTVEKLILKYKFEDARILLDER